VLTIGPTVLNGTGTLRYVGSGDSTNRVLTIGGGGGGTLDASGSGPVRFTNTSSSAFGSTNVAYVLNLGGTNSGENTYAANQANNGSGPFSIVKGGTGTWVLTGASTYTGTTTVSGGTLVVGDGTKGSLGNTAVTVSSGGTLAGTGSIAGSLTVGSGGTLSPGNSPGSQAVGGLVWNGGGNYNWQVLDASGSAGMGYDTYVASGVLDLSALTIVSPFNINLWSLASIGPDVGGNAANFSNAVAQSWTLVATPTPITGFNSALFQVNVGAVNGTSGFTNSLAGGAFAVALGDAGTDLMLTFTPVPEPGSLVLMALAGAMVFGRELAARQSGGGCRGTMARRKV
jgi:autotransporter-associated beta strand protein